MPITVKFYQTTAGAQPVRDDLRALDPDDSKIVGTDIATVERGWPIGMPVCRPLGDGLHEVRSTIREGKVEARTYFSNVESFMVLLVFETGKSGQDEAISLARGRLADYKRRLLEEKKRKAKQKKR